jgi:hypothetical protein
MVLGGLSGLCAVPPTILYHGGCVIKLVWYIPKLNECIFCMGHTHDLLRAIPSRFVARTSQRAILAKLHDQLISSPEKTEVVMHDLVLKMTSKLVNSFSWEKITVNGK